MSRTPRVKFYLEKRKDKKTKEIIENDVPIIFSLSYGNRFKSSTGIRTDKKLWDEEKQRIKSSSNHAPEINQLLSNLRSELEGICYYAWNNGLQLSPRYIASQMKKNQGSAKGFFDHFELFIEQGKKEWAISTVKKFTTIKTHLEDFAEKTKYRIEYDTLDENFIERLTDYYFDEKKYINSYVRKNIRFLKQYLNWATEKGYNKNGNYNKWKLKTGQKQEDSGENIALTMAEFVTIYNKTLESDTMQRTRDFLMFAIGTALRYSDISNLKKTDIDYEQKIIKCTTIKTGKSISIPFNQLSEEVLKKYRNIPIYNKEGVDMALPVISEQKTNDALRDLTAFCEINAPVTLITYRRTKRIEVVKQKHEVVSTKIGRKTLVTWFNSFKIDDKVTMQITGHKNRAMLESYNNQDTALTKEAMKQFTLSNILAKVKESVN